MHGTFRSNHLEIASLLLESNFNVNLEVCKFNVLNEIGVKLILQTKDIPYLAEITLTLPEAKKLLNTLKVIEKE
jgi:hypothetical protein